MTTQADKIAAALRPIAPEGRFMPDEVPILNALGAKWESRLAVAGPPPVTTPGKFALGATSKAELEPVRPELRRCVELAIGYSRLDFRVNQGLRTVAAQKAAVAAGNSRTMKSKHLRQDDGFVWAVDLALLEDIDQDGDEDVSWRFDGYAAIAFAMDRAATELGLAGHIRWGCAWDRVLSDFGGSELAYLAEARAYAKRHAGSDLLDAPHFEWVP